MYANSYRQERNDDQRALRALPKRVLTQYSSPGIPFLDLCRSIPSRLHLSHQNLPSFRTQDRPTIISFQPSLVIKEDRHMLYSRLDALGS